MTNNFFKITATDKNTHARTGVIQTAHGEIETPAFVPVGTAGTVKSLSPLEIKELGYRLFFINTYHLYLSPGENLVAKFGGLHQFIGWDYPLITDSGGFQVFSLARNKKFNGKLVKIMGETETLCRITEEGVTFKSHKDGSLHHFTPEKSMAIQRKLGADLILCFDECTYYPATYQYSRIAMERTHRWALRCLAKVKNKRNNKQALYGIIQGGVYQDLREESAKFISNLPFEGIAIGGVAVGESKKEMKQVLNWVMPLLPEEKPRHLLGVGEIDDIFELIERGIDTFDCVMPTRLGRMGRGLTKYQISRLRQGFGGQAKILAKGRSSFGRKYQNLRNNWTIDLLKKAYEEDKKPIDLDCQCYVCQKFSRAYLHFLFKNRELLGYRLLTYHNLYFISHLIKEIREAIKKGEFLKLKNKWLG